MTQTQNTPQQYLKPSALAIAVAISLGSTGAIFSASALADQQNLRLPQIDVVGKTGEDIALQPGSVTLVTQDDLQRQQPRSTEEALRQVPGVYIKGEEETAVVANIGIRGLSAADYKTLILEDGVPVAPGLFVGNGRYYNPRIQRIGDIEVLKGAAALRYGPSTIGGVINYRTKQPDDGVALTARVGSHGTKESTLEVGGSSPSLDGVFGAVITRAQSDGFMDKGYDMTDAMIKAGMAVGENQWVGVKFTHYVNDANISYRGLFLDDYKAGKTYNPAPDDWFLTERQSFDINHEWDIDGNFKLNTLIYWSQMYRDYWRYGVNANASRDAGRWVYTDSLNGNNRAFERFGVESRLQFAHNSFGMRNQAEVGVRFMTEEMKDQTIQATREKPRTGTLGRDRVDTADSIAVFGQNRFEINDQLAVIPGIRVESYTQERKDLRKTEAEGDRADTSNTEVLPGIGFTYQLNPAAQVFGGVYQAFSPASNGDALDGLKDQDLEAERSLNLEVGLRGQLNQLSYEVTYFRMDFDNQIIPANSNTDYQKTNGGKTLHQGLEGAVALGLGGGFFMQANATWIPDAKFVGTRYEANGVDVSIEDGKRVTYTPELIVNLGLGFENDRFATLLSANHTGSQFTDTDNTKTLAENTSGFFTGQVDSYTTLDLTASYKVTPALNLFGNIKNLTDERYIASLRQGIYVGPERSFELGARYQF